MDVAEPGRADGPPVEDVLSAISTPTVRTARISRTARFWPSMSTSSREGSGSLCTGPGLAPPAAGDPAVRVACKFQEVPDLR